MEVEIEKAEHLQCIFSRKGTKNGQRDKRSSVPLLHGTGGTL
jgi:hypothetical protein